MKKLLLATLLLVSATANAQWHPHSYGYRGYGYNGWVAPALIGGVIGYEIARPHETVIVQQPSVVVQQPCPYPQVPVYNQILTTDQYGRSIYVNQLVGCR